MEEKQNRQIKLIWDFRGTEASKTAAHHQKHLDEFVQAEKLKLKITGVEDMTDMHSIAYLVVQEDMMKEVRDRLIPHRGELYNLS